MFSRNQPVGHIDFLRVCIEYLLVCTKCEEQTGYSYPLFALQNAWEHILNTEHNVVTILEIAYDRGIIHEISS